MEENSITKVEDNYSKRAASSSAALSGRGTPKNRNYIGVKLQ